MYVLRVVRVGDDGPTLTPNVFIMITFIIAIFNYKFNNYYYDAVFLEGGQTSVQN